MNALRKQKMIKRNVMGKLLFSFVKIKTLVDIQKHDFILKGKEKVITFESSKIWDDTKIIENIYVKKIVCTSEDFMEICNGVDYLDQVKELIIEYTKRLGRDLSFQNIDEEL